MKVRLHRKVCPNPPEVSEEISEPKKAMMLEEAQLIEPERRKRVLEHHW